mgnify:CR=1 FL=1
MPENADQTVELLQRWHANDSTALAKLLENHLPLLRDYVRSRLHPLTQRLSRELDASDVVQTTAVQLLQYTPKFRPRDGAQFQALLRTFVENALRNELRAPRHRRRDGATSQFSAHVVDMRGSSDSSGRPDRAAEKAEDRALAWLALQFLEDDDDRELVELVAVDECGWAEVGARFNLAPDAARMRYKRVLPRLANYMRRLREGGVDELLAARHRMSSS